MSSNTGTLRTPRGQGRGAVPPSGIPRPVADTSSDIGTSAVSASREKQSKRDEVRPVVARCDR